jgi:glutamate--cysteine ligase
MKTLYRQGLKNRYGSLMQVIAGIHYNFSLPPIFWREWSYLNKLKYAESYPSKGYLHIIRNYYRYGWLIPYLFGASPAICSSFLQGSSTPLHFEGNINKTIWLPYATSLRLSQVGYTNRSQIKLCRSLNSLNDYVDTLRLATTTPSKEFSRIGNRDNRGNLLQLNTNILQVENELYAPIRPKRNLYKCEKPSDALARGGIEYIEVRSLDINPFSEVGIELLQLKLIDLFLIWCILADSPKISSDELLLSQNNWDRIVLTGRQPNQKVDIGRKQYSLAIIGEKIVSDLRCIAKVFDDSTNRTSYVAACEQFYPLFEDSSLTYSARILDMIKDNGFTETGINLAKKYSHGLLQSGFDMLSLEEFSRQVSQSWNLQRQQEEADTLDFTSYLSNYHR